MNPVFKYRPLCLMIGVFSLTLFILFRFVSPVSFITFLSLVLLFLLYFFLVFLKKKDSYCRQKILASLFSAALAALVSFGYQFLILSSLQKYDQQEFSVEIGIEEVTYRSPSYTVATGKLLSLDGHFSYRTVSVELTGHGDVSTGDRIIAKGTVESFYPEKNVSLYYHGSIGSVSGLHHITLTHDYSSPTVFFLHIRDFLAKRIEACCPGNAGRFYSALFLGIRSTLPGTVKLNFSRLGITHLLAISGMHFTVIVLSLDKFLKYIFCPQRLRAIINISVSFFYMALTGFSPSVSRAGLMLIFMMACLLFMDEYDDLNSLFIAVFILFFFQPYSIYNVGLWLSFMATLAILVNREFKVGRHSAAEEMEALRAKIENRAKKHRFRRFFRRLWGPVRITLMATFATLPITAFAFGTVSLLSPLANLLLAAPASLAIYFSIIAAIFGDLIPPLGFILRVFGELLLFSADLLGSIPNILISLRDVFSKIVVVLLFICAFVFLVVKARPKKELTLCALTATILLLASHGIMYLDELSPSVHYVGDAQGSYVILRKSGETVVYDASTETSQLRNQMQETVLCTNETEIDIFVVSHYSVRLEQNLSKLCSNLRMGQVLFPAPLTEKDEQIYKNCQEILKPYRIDADVYQDDDAFSLRSCKIFLYQSAIHNNLKYGFSLVFPDKTISFCTPSLLQAPSRNFFSHLEETETLILSPHGGKSQTCLFSLRHYPNIRTVILGNKEKTAFSERTEEALSPIQFLKEPFYVCISPKKD